MEELQPMDAETLESWIGNALTEAIDHIDNDESPTRATAMRYYLGNKFVESEHTPTEVEGRSQYISRDIHDAVHQLLPSIMRVLFSGENVVEFEPRGMDDVPLARQATEYCNYLLRCRNNGYVLLDTAIKDALIKGVGVLQVWYEQRTEERVRELSNLDMPTAAGIAQSGAWQILDYGQDQNGISMRISQTLQDGRLVIDAVPPEEFLINRNAVSIEDAKLVARRQRLKISDLVELGFDFNQIIELADVDDTYKSNEEWLLRNPTWREEEQTESDPANREVLFIEAYARVDVNGDGKAELRKITCIGSAHKVVRNVPIDDHPFVLFRMDMLPHHWSGLSLYTELGDVQRTKSAVVRNMLDSLALSTTPRMAFVEGQVEYNDIANDEVGALIPMRAAGAVQQLEIPFVGQAAFPMLEWLDAVISKRTGLSAASQGMDAESLQSTTAVGVEATVKAAQARLELITRNLIETGIKPLFEKMLRLITYHQEKSDIMMLRGEYQPVDPTSWPMMNVRVSMPIGAADIQGKTAVLMQVIQRQESIMEKLGPDNAFAGVKNYHAALMKLLELNGVTEAQNYFEQPQALLQQLQQQAQQEQPQKTPEQILAEAQVQIQQMDVLAKAAEQAREDDRKRDQMSIDLFLKATELKAKYGIPLDLSGLVQELNRNRELDVVEQRTQTERYQQALAQLQQQAQAGQQAPMAPATPAAPGPTVN